MSPQDGIRGRELLQAAIGPTAECVPIERFASLSANELAHVERCAHCEAELSLWQQFEANEPSADEGAAVQWIATELARRRAPNSAAIRAPRFNWFGGRAFAALAAGLLVVVAIGYSVIDREPSIGALPGDVSTYRGSAIHVAEPVGDLTAAPERLRWLPHSAAARYDVVIHEIDGTTIWSGSSTAPEVTLPRSVITQFAPGRSLTWEVTARDPSGAIVARSGTQRFRVVPRS
jgi:hypothetical protein